MYPNSKYKLVIGVIYMIIYKLEMIYLDKVKKICLNWIMILANIIMNSYKNVG